MCMRACVCVCAVQYKLQLDGISITGYLPTLSSTRCHDNYLILLSVFVSLPLENDVYLWRHLFLYIEDINELASLPCTTLPSYDNIYI